MTDLREIVEQISAYEHMGLVCVDAQIDIVLKSNSLSIFWDAVFEGKLVRQAAFFKFTAIQLGGDE